MMVKRIKRIKGLIFGFLAVIILGICSVFLVSWYVIAVGQDRIYTAEEVRKGDAVIVLGAYVHPNGQVSPILRDRLEVGYNLYKMGVAPKIIVSGDHGQKDYNEVRAMREFLLQKGVPSDDIFMDHAGFDTYNSLYRARDVFCVQNPVIVSQRYHLLRANYIAVMLGMDAVGVASDLRQYSAMAAYEMREWGSRYKAFIECLFRVQPRFLGDAIPVWGSGEQTLDE